MSNDIMNDNPSSSSSIHEHTRETRKIRNDRQSIGSQYTVDVFPRSTMIDVSPSPSTSLSPKVVPMHHTAPPPPLLELSFAEAIDRIEAAESLPSDKQRQWVCSLRQIAKGLDRPLALVPARWTALHLPVSRLHHLALGITPKTLSNHKANLRAALKWISGETGLPVRGAPLTPAWGRLLDKIADKGMRARLFGLVRYASAKGIEPEAVDDDVLAAFLRYRAETTALAAGVAAHRSVARTWNRCVDEIDAWPRQRLAEPDLPSRRTGPEWQEFPEILRFEVDAYLGRLTKARRTRSGKRVQACKGSTIRTRRAELVAFARKAVETGIPVAELTTLATLLDPAVVRRVLDAYWNASGDAPNRYTIDLAWKLLSIARETDCLSESKLRELDDLRAVMEEHRQPGLTEKNLAVIRQVIAGPVWREVVRLPDQLMAEARLLKDQAPVKAALRAQLAVAIAILSVAPIRVGNLVRIRLEENLIRPTGPNGLFALVFPFYDVKNRIKLEFPLDAYLTALIEEYVHDHRAALLRGQQRALALSGGKRRPQDALDVLRADHRGGAEGDGSAPHGAPVQACRRRPDAAGRARKL